MKTFAMFGAILASATFVAEAAARTQVPRPAGQSSPLLGAQTLAQKEEEAVGAKVLTGLAVKDRGPATR